MMCSFARPGENDVAGLPMLPVPVEATMSDLEDFLAHTLQRHALATTGVRNGDATALIEMLSTRDPVTLFPAAQPAKRCWTEVSQEHGSASVAAARSSRSASGSPRSTAGRTTTGSLVHRHGDPGHGRNPAVEHLRAELRNRTGEDVPT
jgi:hypothetical protein